MDACGVCMGLEGLEGLDGYRGSAEMKGSMRVFCMLCYR